MSIISYFKKCIKPVWQISFRKYNTLASLSKGQHGVTYTSRRCYSIYQPDNLDYIPDIPEYDCLSISLKGYDYVVLENYSKYVLKLFQGLGYELQGFPLPADTTDIKTLKPRSTNVKDVYNLATYHRILRVENVPGTTGSILFEVLQQNLPSGVEMVIKEPSEEEDEYRYIPDVLLNDLKDQVDEIEQAKEDRKRK